VCTQTAVPPARPTRRACALLFSLAGAACLILSGFLRAHSPPPGFVPFANTLWQVGPGWSLVAGGGLVAILVLRAARRRRRSWAGLWLGPPVIVLAVRGISGGTACDRFFRCVDASAGPGLYLAGAGGVCVLLGWLLGLGAAGARLASDPPQAPDPPPMPSPARAPGRVTAGPAAWALALYLAVSVVLFGGRVVPHLSSQIIGANDGDPNAYMWFLAWWPHAVVAGLNPFTTGAIFAPDGYNLAWATSVPAPSLLIAPVTLALGPVASFNLLAVFGPALAAWTGFLLCRHVTGSTAPALAGGYVFGFSPYMLEMLQGEPNLYLVAPVPLLVLLVLRALDGTLRPRRFVAFTALVLALQALTSLEVLVTTAFFGATAMLIAAGLFPHRRTDLVRVAGHLGVATAVAGILISPMLFFLFARPHVAPVQATPAFAGDLASWVVPAPEMAIARSHNLAAAPPYPFGSYLGLPLVGIVLAYAWRHRRERRGQFLVLCVAIPALASLGGRLEVHGQYTPVGLPWGLMTDVPGLDHAIPARFSLFTFLAAAVLLAVWLGSRATKSRWFLALAALLVLVPAFGSPAWRYRLPKTPALFTSARYRRVLQTAEQVLVYPIFDGERWQAEANFRFRLADGAVGAYPTSFLRYPIFNALLLATPIPDGNASLRRFIADKDIDAIVVSAQFAGPFTDAMFGSLGVRPVDIAGARVYRLGA